MADPREIPQPPAGFQIQPAGSNMPAPPPGFEVVGQSRPDAGPTFYDSWVAPAGRGIASAAEGVHDFFVGKEDPKFGPLPSIDEPEIMADAGLDISTLQQAKTVGFTDDQYRDILSKQLGNRFLGIQKDANGFSVITYAGADGRPRQAYVNKPGLDMQDVDRGISSTLPFLAAGGVMGRVAANAPLAARAVGQAVAGGTASVGQDIAAQGMGSQQGLDPTKALLAAGGGAAGELIGAGISKLLQKYRIDNRMVDQTGKLSDAGRRLAERQGFDPNLIDDELAGAIARLSAQAENSAEALAQVQTGGRFGIPTTKGQRTKDQNLLQGEKDIRHGAAGKPAQDKLTEFDRQQQLAIERAARGSRDATPVDPEATIAPNLAPGRTFADQNQITLGEGAKEGFETAVKAARGEEKQFWKKVKDLQPTPAAKDLLPENVNKMLKGETISAENHPQSALMLEKLKSFMSGEAPQTNFGPFAPASVPDSMGELRKTLTKMVRDADTKGGDRGFARQIYQGYMEWMSEVSRRKLIAGDVKDVEAMRKAMDVTKEVRNLIRPTDMKGKATGVTRVFDKLENATTGEEVLTALLGATGPKGSFKAEGVKALESYKKLVMSRGGEPGRQAWNDVRLAYWMKLVTGKDGEMATPRMIKSNIQTAMRNQGSVFKSLYGPKERDMMRGLVEAMKVVDAPDPNPSGTGSAIARLGAKLGREAARGQAQRERLVKGRIMVANIYRAIATVMRSAEKTTGRASANRAVTQKLSPRKSPSLGGFGSSAATNALVPRSEQPQR